MAFDSSCLSAEVFPAHIRCEQGKYVVQSVKEHCINTAVIASEKLECLKLSKTAYLAGLLHDMGKCTHNFKDYIWASVKGEKVVRGSVNHTFAGVKYVLDNHHSAESADSWSDLTAEFVAYAIGAHHSLFDCVDSGHNSGFRHRQNRTEINYQEAVSNFLKYCCAEKELKNIFDESQKELAPVLQSFYELSIRNEDKKSPKSHPIVEEKFYSSLLARLILSAVIEGDRQDTASFMNGNSFTGSVASWKKILCNVESKIRLLPGKSPIEKARQSISQQCADFAYKPAGVYRLNVPTGAGKTLSSLRYALSHANVWNKSRIILSSPLLSILEQNAKIVRDYIKDDSLILEHHSNVINDGKSEEELDRYELLSENWSFPVILTTLVQLLNTLFSGKSSCIRRFSSLCNSVIVIDEVQTIPTKMISLFNLAVNFLTNYCNTTVVLCSATQPCLERAIHPLLDKPAEIVPYRDELWRPFKRTEIKDAGAKSLEELPDFIKEKLQYFDSMLIVCNEKKEAQGLYRSLAEDFECYHLSAAMCVQHRRDTLEAIKKSLSSEKKTICVSTQVIEAGVDISFDCVIRLAAGMDNIIQSAGRCNRNGEKTEIQPVYVIQCSDENLAMLKEIKRSKNATIALLTEFAQKSDDFSNDLSSDKAIEYYYRRLYEDMPTGHQNYMLSTETSILQLLSLNEKYNSDLCKDGRAFFLCQAFKDAGNSFNVFDENTTDIIVSYGAGKEIINKLASNSDNYDLFNLSKLLVEAKPYTVSVYRHQKERLMKEGALNAICENHVYYLSPDYYDREIGLSFEPCQNCDEMEFIK